MTTRTEIVSRLRSLADAIEHAAPDTGIAVRLVTVFPGDIASFEYTGAGIPLLPDAYVIIRHLAQMESRMAKSIAEGVALGQRRVEEFRKQSKKEPS